MNDLEQKLQSARLAAPSPDLDRRMEDAFRTARQTAEERPARGMSWRWLAAAAAVGGLAATLLFVSPRQSQLPPRPVPEPEPVVYQVEAQGRMRDMLLDPRASPDEPLRWDFHVHTP